MPKWPHGREMESILTVSKWFSLRRCAGLAAVLTIAAVAQAQPGPDEDQFGSAGQLELPKDITLFGKSDPNVRKATAIINGTVLTETDVEHRLALVVLANGGKVSDEEKERLRLQVLRNLIDETLQIQEAGAKEIKVDPAELDQNFTRVASNFKYSPAGFAKYLKEQGSSEASIKRQIEGEVAWTRLLRRTVSPLVNVSEDEVRAVIERLKASKGSDEFRIGEIYLSAPPERSQAVFESVENIMTQLRQGGSFQAYARQFSEASTASVGGDLGWVRAAQLPDELASTAQTMQVGQIAGPIAVPGGFSILLLLDKRQVLTADPRDALLNLKQISISFPPNTTTDAAQKVATEFGEAAKTLRGCGGVDELAAKLRAEVVENDGVKARDLPPQLQGIMLALQVGEATQPFGSLADGVRVLVLCGRDDPVDAGQPSFDEVMSQMEEERVNKRARAYLRDLRRDAVIDYN
jgi:peptidyl-prolyl cis-trans isomerase SurA